MSQMVEGNTKSFVGAATALERCRRVKLAAGVLAYAGLADREIGVLTARCEANDHAGVYLRTMAGTVQMVAADSFSLGAVLYTAADGKVSDASGAGALRIGIALEAASGDGSIVEVLRDNQEPAFASGAYTVVADDATANLVDIVTGLGAITSMNVMIVRSNIPRFLDQVITKTAGTIRVADGASTYNTTAGDVIYWQAWG